MKAFALILPCGRTTLLSAQDYRDALHYSWTISAAGYARATVDGRRMTLHRFVIERADPKSKRHSGHVVDHINGDRLDNRRENLRLATPSQNSMNAARAKRGGYRGVTKTSGGKFQASIRLRAAFDTAEEAARQYDKWARAFHGQFATVNFPNHRLRERGAVKPDWKAVLEEAQANDMTVTQLAREFGFTPAGIRYQMAKHGLPLRSAKPGRAPPEERLAEEYRRRA